MKRKGMNDITRPSLEQMVRLMLVLLMFLLWGCFYETPKEISSPVDTDPEKTRQIQQGRVVYQQFCTSCHDSDGDGRLFSRGTNLRKKAGSLNFQGIVQTLSPDTMQSNAADNPHAGFKIDQQQKQDVANFLLLELLKEER